MNAPERFFEQQHELGMCPAKFATFVNRSIAAQTREDFLALLKEALQPIFPHGMLLAGIGRVEPGGIVVESFTATNYPQAYVNKLNHQPIWAGPILANWLNTQRPQLYEQGNSNFPVPQRWARAMQRHNLQNIAAHGVKDLRSHSASYFTFSKIPGVLSNKHARTLEMIVPLLHPVLARILIRSNPLASIQNAVVDRPIYSTKYQDQILTPREQDILSWLRQGKTNIEIAESLGSSPNTVRNQLQQLFTKFQANNRTQLIALVTRENQIRVSDY